MSQVRDLLLDEALNASPSEARAIFRDTEPRRREVAESLRSQDDLASLAHLRLKESLLYLREGMTELAFSRVHEAWTYVNGRSSGDVQALILTQLGACYERRGDRRGALRAVRRAEALLVSQWGEDLPQVLAVRAQLVTLLESHGLDAGPARRRLEKTWSCLGLGPQDEAARTRHQRLRAVFVDGQKPPHWAQTYGSRWREVFYS